MKLSKCFIKSFRDLFSLEIVKAVLISSVPVFLIYAGILIFFWDHIINVSEFLISWVPFSVLRINGAFFILFFLWFLSVAISFAILSAIFGAFLVDKSKDKGYYFYTVISIVFFSILYAFLFIKNWDFINHELQKLLIELPFTTVSEGVGAIVAIYIFYNLFILTLYLLIFLFAKPFLSAIKDMEYPDVNIEVKGKFKYKRIILKDALMFVFLFIILFPLFFIPVVNLAVQLFLWSKLYHDSFVYFVCSEYCSNEDFEELKKEKIKTYLAAVLAALLNFIPIINFFSPFFAIVMFFHCVMQMKTSN
jgi:hypothetical protein